MSNTAAATQSTAIKRNRKSKKGGSQVVDTTADNKVAETSVSTPIAAPASVDGSSDVKRESETLKELMKRERKVKKKLTLIEASENKIKDLPEAEKATTSLLNADERRKIAEKPTVLAVHKEQTEILALVNRLVKEEEERLNAEKEALQAAHAKEVEEAKEAGKAEGQEEITKHIRVLLKFLRAASYRRANVGPAEMDTEENKAVDEALFAVYEGGEHAFQSCMKLGAGLDEPVNDDCSITWARIREIAHELDEQEPEVSETQEEAPAAEQTEETPKENAPATEEETKESEAKDITSTEPEAAQAEAPAVESAPNTSVNDDALAPEATTPTESKPAEAPAEATPEQGWGEEAHEAHVESEKKSLQTDGADDSAQANNGGNFEDVAPRRGRGRGGWRGRGEHRGGHRGRGEFRGRGGFRGGDRGGRGGEHRGGYRGRGGEGRGRGDHRRQHSNNNQQGQQDQQQPATAQAQQTPQE